MGDLLMAMPAMREGDSVIANPLQQIPLPVQWLSAGIGNVPVRLGRGKHETVAWCEAANRQPYKHVLLENRHRSGIVIAPSVVSTKRQWDKWDELLHCIPDAKVVGPDVPRAEWMEVLASAHTVICPDTGTAHMADALCVPKLIVLHGNGEMHFNRYAPYWNRSNCIVKDSMKDISVEDIMERLNG